jgi:D-xylose transport system substrate-binding protein
MMEVIGADVDAGKIKIVGESFSDGWKPENAQKNMEQILTANDNNVDAVLSENDGMAGGVVAALSAQGLVIPVGGQDGDLGSDQPRCTRHANCVRLERCPRSG